jgi:predicted nucleic acid-binding protein
MTLKLYLDTNVFVEGFEKQGKAPDIARSVFAMVRSGATTAVISDLVVAELLVIPLRTADQELIDTYSELFNSPVGYQTFPVDRKVLLEAARQRAINSGTKWPDAIHIATVRLQGCRVFLTTDARLLMPPDVLRLTLDSTTIAELESLA